MQEQELFVAIFLVFVAKRCNMVNSRAVAPSIIAKMHPYGGVAAWQPNMCGAGSISDQNLLWEISGRAAAYC